MNFLSDKSYVESVRLRLAKHSHRDVGGCCTWHGQTGGKGYGSIKTRDGTKRAHRVSYAVNVGPIPDGATVMHTCDNRLCVNPDHLRLGTHKENMEDMRRKGRQARGERQGRARLTEDAVRDIRTGRLSDTEFSSLYGVSREAVYDARVGRYWSHVA